MNILIIIDHYNKGGAFTSNTLIIDSLTEIKNTKIKVLTQTIKNRLLAAVTLDSYLSIPSIIKNIFRFKPDVIITQGRMAFPAILISKIMKIPVIHIIRSTVDFCPKYVDIINYGKACDGIFNKKYCFNCIDKWRTLRILIGNRPKGSEYTIKTSLVNILYKIRYFICSFNLYLIKKANINLVASNIMIDYFSYSVNQNKFEIVNITPIKRFEIAIEAKEKHLLFVRTEFETSHKGYDFIKKLSKIIPKEYWIIVVGGNNLSFMEKGYLNIIKLDYISSKESLNEVISQCIITLVPTFCTEAFGRVIPESLKNKTPVISSPQCGANQFFEDIDFLKVVPLKLDLWVKTIEDMILNPPFISNTINSIFREQFSQEKCKQDFIKIIKKILKKRGKENEYN